MPHLPCRQEAAASSRGFLCSVLLCSYLVELGSYKWAGGLPLLGVFLEVHRDADGVEEGGELADGDDYGGCGRVAGMGGGNVQRTRRFGGGRVEDASLADGHTILQRKVLMQAFRTWCRIGLFGLHVDRMGRGWECVV